MKFPLQQLTAAFKADPSGGYIAYIVEMDGVNTQGETIQEAKENLVDALQGMIEIRQEEAQQQKDTSFEPLIFA